MPSARASIALVKDGGAVAVLINNSHSIVLALQRLSLKFPPLIRGFSSVAGALDRET